MSETVLASLSSTLSQPSLLDAARHLGESEQAVSHGIELSTAAILSGLADKAADSETMRQIVDLAFRIPLNPVPSNLNSDRATNLSTSLTADGKRFLSYIFGGGQETILNSVSRESGLRTGAASTVMAMATQSVLGFLGTRIRQEGMTATGLSSFLQRQRESLRSSLPAGLKDAVASSLIATHSTTPVIAQTVETNSVIAQNIVKERSKFPWLLFLVLALLLGVLGYSLLHSHKATVEVEIPAATVAGNFVQRQLPDGDQLNVPQDGVEGKLLAFVQDPGRTPDQTTWFDFDRLLFDTGSATLQPQSQEQLTNIAAILKAYPNLHLRIGGYTDATGSADQNLKLSQDRADNVVGELLRLGISQDRLAAQGYGEDHPVASNSTEETRAQNRRISMLVTQK